MQHFDSHNPNRAFVQSPFVLPMDVGVEGLLRGRAKPKPPASPSPQVLLSQLPRVVEWLRDAMIGRGVREEGSSGKPGSKPPFRIAFMSAADREVADAAYWAEVYRIPIVSRAWRVGGVVRGVASDDTSVVDELVEKLMPAFDNFLFPDILTHPRHGLWQTRAGHFATWPQLAALFQSDRFDEPQESDQLELL